MVMKALQQLLHEVDWGGLDILVLDLPPGTGDTQLTITQQIVLDGMFHSVQICLPGLSQNRCYYHINAPRYRSEGCFEGNKHVQNSQNPVIGHDSEYVSLHMSTLPQQHTYFRIPFRCNSCVRGAWNPIPRRYTAACKYL